ncbi:4Fe-4S dicluster domain-containing protein [Anaerobacillus sp. HL2]|nr:4Fe-4S dicluster domain-containing protein [Anaerobacillus sp. HL2]
MHCIDAPCQKLCPFGVIRKKPNKGAVKIDTNFCMGGAKCRTVCPWDIPQRQAGVGLYMKLAPDLAGGGVMYKCDMCSDLLAKEKALLVKLPVQMVQLNLAQLTK